MARPHNKLTAVTVRTLTKPGRFADGNGLYLLVGPRSGTKRWVLRTVVNNRRRDIGLGSVTVTSLAEARDEAARLRKMARKGEDPLARRRIERQQIPTFESAARIVYESRKAAWRNPKHQAQWLSSLKTYAFPSIGVMLVNEIRTRDVLTVLSPIWLAKPETARRVRQRISIVLDWAKAMGDRTDDNPVEGVTKGLASHIGSTKHHPALLYVEVRSFIQRLREADSALSVRLAFEFTILTAARTSEVPALRAAELPQSDGGRVLAGAGVGFLLLPVAIRITLTALPITSAGRFWPLGPVDIH